eukprot:1460668-Amphidinium_carterae.1
MAIKLSRSALRGAVAQCASANDSTYAQLLSCSPRTTALCVPHNDNSRCCQGTHVGVFKAVMLFCNKTGASHLATFCLDSANA